MVLKYPQPLNSVYNCIMEIRYKNLFENKAKPIKPFNLRIQNLNEIKINTKMDHKSTNRKTRTNQIIHPPITFKEKFSNI